MINCMANCTTNTSKMMKCLCNLLLINIARKLPNNYVIVEKKNAGTLKPTRVVLYWHLYLYSCTMYCELWE